jgi:hypothetical protein
MFLLLVFFSSADKSYELCAASMITRRWLSTNRDGGALCSDLNGELYEELYARLCIKVLYSRGEGGGEGGGGARPRRR